jgi:hypothetical protein
MVPPCAAVMVWATVAIVPATMTVDIAVFVGSATLIALTVTVKGLGTVTGAV